MNNPDRQDKKEKHTEKKNIQKRGHFYVDIRGI